MERYKVHKSGVSTYGVFDKKRNCCIVKTVSPNANYNQEVVEYVVKLLNEREQSADSRPEELPLQRVVKLVCPRCGSDRWSEDGKMIKQCFDCEYVWQTVL